MPINQQRPRTKFQKVGLQRRKDKKNQLNKNRSIQQLKKNEPKSKIKQSSTYENIEINKQIDLSSQDEDGFTVEQDQQTTDLKGIKTKQFWTGLVTNSSNVQNMTQDIQFNLKCSQCFGYNSMGRDTVILIDNQICRAVGCMLIHKQNIYSQHQFRISILAYDKQTNSLLSGSQGVKPEVVLWKYNSKEKQLKFVKKFYLIKCEPIIKLAFFKDEKFIVITKYTLNKDSNLFLFDKKQGKKSMLKVQKCQDLQILKDENNIQKNHTFIVNNKGIAQIIQRQNQILLEYIFIYDSTKSTEQLKCIYPFYTQKNKSQNKFDIIYGKKNGQVYFLNNKNIKENKIHQGSISKIKRSLIKDQEYFITISQHDFHVAIFVIEKNKKQFKLIRKFMQKGYARNLFIQNKILLIGTRDGNINLYDTQKLINTQLSRQSLIKRFKSFGCFNYKQSSNKQFFKYNKKMNTFVYGSSQLKHIWIYSPNNKQKQFEKHPLIQCPQTMSINNNNNILAYTYDSSFNQQLLNETHQKLSKSLQILSARQYKQNLQKMSVTKQEFLAKSVLVLQNMQTKKIINMINFNLQNRMIKNISLIEFSQDGKYLVIGYQDGNISVLFDLFSQGFQKQNKTVKIMQKQKFYNSNQKNNNLIFLQKKHKQPIIQFTWSIDNSKLKSCSQSQIYYWQISQQIQKNLKPKQTKQIIWSNIGRFNGQNIIIWNKVGSAQEINQIMSNQILIIDNESDQEVIKEKLKVIAVSYNDGRLIMYSAPLTNNSTRMELKVFDQKFQMFRNQSKNDDIRFWIVFQGIVLSLNLIIS